MLMCWQLQRHFQLQIVPNDVKNFKQRRQIAAANMLDFLSSSNRHHGSAPKESTNPLHGASFSSDHQHLQQDLQVPPVNGNLDFANAGVVSTISTNDNQRPNQLPLDVERFLEQARQGNADNLSFGQLQRIAQATGFNIMPKEFDSFQHRRLQAIAALKKILFEESTQSITAPTPIVDGSDASIVMAQQQSQVVAIC